eukprot:2506475-Pyramimonas_sp.AAC.1
MNLDDNTIIQDINIQDQPTGYNYNAQIPNGVTNVRARFYWEQPEAALLGHGGPRPRPRRVAIVAGDRPPPPSIERGRVLPSIPEFPTLSSPGAEQSTALPNDARIKQKE